MVLFTGVVLAAATDCPEVNLPSDAKQQYPGDVEAFYASIAEWAETTWDASCIQDCEDFGEYEICKVADCVTPEGVGFTYSLVQSVEDGTTSTARIIEFTSAAEMSWDAFYYSSVETESEDYISGDTQSITRWESSWTGTIEDLPKDFDAVGTVTTSTVYETGSTSDSIEFDEDDGCYWRWTHDVYLGEERAFYEVFQEWSIQTFATENFSVEQLFGGCDEAYGGVYVASLNGDYLGQVDGSSWSFIGKDDDGDGWSIEGGDPDDNDSLLVACSDIEEEEEEEEDNFDNKLCGLATPLGFAPLGLVLLALRRRRDEID